MMRAPALSALAISTSCCWARESWPSGVRLEISSPSLAKNLIRLAIDAFAIDQLEHATRGWFATEKDVGGDVEIVENAEFLVNELDAESAGLAWRAYLNRLAVDLDSACIA